MTNASRTDQVLFLFPLDNLRVFTNGRPKAGVLPAGEETEQPISKPTVVLGGGNIYLFLITEVLMDLFL